MENTKQYSNDLPGIGGHSFVVTLKDVEFHRATVGIKTYQAMVDLVEEVQDCGYWIPYHRDNLDEKRNIECKRYMVHRQDGKMHWETFNGTGWAYNDSVITHYADITPPL